MIHFRVFAQIKAGPDPANIGLSHFPLDKMAAISQTIFSDAFS